MTFPLDRPARIAVFASGRGSNLRSLIAAFPPGDALASVNLVLSSRAGAGALELAAAHGVPAYSFPFPSRKRDPDGRARTAFEAAATEQLGASCIDLICLAGFMRIFSPEFSARWRGRILNVHPSLLPAFPGLQPQQQALSAGVETSGCTVHFVDAGVDTGTVVLQRPVPVYPDDTEAALAARILVEEHRAYPEAVRRVLKGRAQAHDQTQTQAHTKRAKGSSAEVLA